MRHKSDNYGAGVEDSSTDLKEEGDTNGDGYVDASDEEQSEYGFFENDDDFNWAVDDAMEWEESDTAEQEYGNNNWIDWKDRNITDQNSALYGAVQRVQDMAVNDPNAKQLLTNYSNSSATLDQAVKTAQADKSLDNFLALRIAQDQNMLDKAAIVKLDGDTVGDSEEQRWAEKQSEHAQADMQALQNIQQLPPEQRQAAFDKLLEGDPNGRHGRWGSPVAREWQAYQSGDFSAYQNTEKTLDAQAAPQQSYNDDWSGWGGWGSSACSIYDTPGSSSSSFSYWEQNPLSSTFYGASSGTSSTAPTPTNAPGATPLQQSNTRQTYTV